MFSIVGFILSISLNSNSSSSISVALFHLPTGIKPHYKILYLYLLGNVQRSQEYKNTQPICQTPQYPAWNTWNTWNCWCNLRIIFLFFMWFLWKSSGTLLHFFIWPSAKTLVPFSHSTILLKSICQSSILDQSDNRHSQRISASWKDQTPIALVIRDSQFLYHGGALR